MAQTGIYGTVKRSLEEVNRKLGSIKSTVSRFPLTKSQKSKIRKELLVLIKDTAILVDMTWDETTPKEN